MVSSAAMGDHGRTVKREPRTALAASSMPLRGVRGAGARDMAGTRSAQRAAVTRRGDSGQKKKTSSNGPRNVKAHRTKTAAPCHWVWTSRRRPGLGTTGSPSTTGGDWPPATLASPGQHNINPVPYWCAASGADDHLLLVVMPAGEYGPAPCPASCHCVLARWAARLPRTLADLGSFGQSTASRCHLPPVPRLFVPSSPHRCARPPLTGGMTA